MKNMKKILLSAILMIGLIVAPNLNAATKATISDVKANINGVEKAFTVDQTDATKLTLSVGYSTSTISLNFVSKDSQNGENTEVAIKDENGTLIGYQVSSVLNLSKVGKNTFTLEIKDKDDDTETTKTVYTLEITRAEQALARLTDLKVKNGNDVLSFDKPFDKDSNQTYTITVENDVKSVVIAAEYDKDKITSVSGDGEHELWNVGDDNANEFSIYVYSVDGDRKEYKIVVYRKESQLILDLKQEIGNDWDEISIEEDENGKEFIGFAKYTNYGEANIGTGYVVYLTDEVNDKDTVLAALEEALKKEPYISQVFFNGDNYALTEDLLKGIKKLTGNVNVYGYNGSWVINAANLTDEFKGLNFKILVGEDVEEALRNKVLGLIENKEKGLVIDFAHDGKLPKGTKVQIGVDPEQFSEDEELTLYLYNTTSGKLNEVVKKLKVLTGEYGQTYVEFELDHCSTYVLTTSSNNAQTGVLNVVFYVIMSLVSLAGIIFLTKKKAN